MIGVTAYLDGGITLDAYYQLEQKELELDAAGSFFGSELVGVGANTGILSSPNYNEIAARPYAGNYHDIAECTKSLLLIVVLVVLLAVSIYFGLDVLLTEQEQPQMTVSCQHMVSIMTSQLMTVSR